MRIINRKKIRCESLKQFKFNHLILGFPTKDVITNEKKSFAAFTIGRKVGEDTLYMNCIAFPNQKFKIPKSNIS